MFHGSTLSVALCVVEVMLMLFSYEYYELLLFVVLVPVEWDENQSLLAP